MERLTFLNGDDIWCVDNDHCYEEQSEHYCGPAIDRLAAYEDLEEQGRLVVLPCKAGDTVWVIRESYWPGGRIERRISEEVVDLLTIGTNEDDYTLEAFGKTVFLTREEAEAALMGGAG